METVNPRKTIIWKELKNHVRTLHNIWRDAGHSRRQIADILSVNVSSAVSVHSINRNGFVAVATTVSQPKTNQFKWHTNQELSWVYCALVTYQDIVLLTWKFSIINAARKLCENRIFLSTTHERYAKQSSCKKFWAKRKEIHF